MDILIVSATPFEIAPTLDFLEKNFPQREPPFFHWGEIRVLPLISGVGIPATVFSLTNIFAQWKPTLALNVGIAGSFSPALAIGSVVNVVSERFGDLGVEESDGRFTDVFDMNLVEKNSTPYSNGELQNPEAAKFDFLPKAKGLTVNKVHGFQPSIDGIRKKYPDAEIESMEGAAFFYSCLMAEVPFLEIRSISNRVEARNRENWNLPLAIKNLNEVVLEILESIQNQ